MAALIQPPRQRSPACNVSKDVRVGVEGDRARISRRGIDTSERLGRHRWVVKRTAGLVGTLSAVEGTLREASRHLPGVPQSWVRWSAVTYYNGFC